MEGKRKNGYECEFCAHKASKLCDLDTGKKYWC